MKKLLIVLMLMAAMLSSCAAPDGDGHDGGSAATPVPTATPVPVECAEGSYILLEDGTAMITYAVAEECGSWTVPAQMDGHPVTGLGDMAVHHGWLKNVVVPAEYLTWLDDENKNIARQYQYYFCGSPFCWGLDVVIPDEVTCFNGEPFDHYNLVTVSPDHPTLALIDHVLYSKADKTLLHCPVMLPTGELLRDLVIPHGIRTIGAYSCCSVESVQIPDTVTSIGEGAFAGSGLTSVVIPDSVTNLGVPGASHTNIQYRTFEEVDFPKPVETVAVNGVFSNNRSLTSVTLGSGLKAIPANTFSGCYSLPSITIPEGVTSIGEQAFADCSSLSSVVLPASVADIADNAFERCPAVTFTVARNSYAAQWCKSKNYTYTYTDANDWLLD